MSIMIALLSGCTNGCETAEEMATDLKIINIDSSLNQWVNTDIYIGPGANLKFDVLNAEVNLCELNIAAITNLEEVSIDRNKVNRTNAILDTKINLEKDEQIKFEFIEKKIQVETCENTTESQAKGIWITDAEKCKNGYVKADGTRIPKYLGRTITLKDPTSYKIGNDANKYEFHNILIPLDILSKIRPGYALIIPEEYETISEELDDQGNKTGKPISSYNWFPPMTEDHTERIYGRRGIVGWKPQAESEENYQKRIKAAEKKYWCGELSFAPSDKIDGYKLNKFCNNYLDLNVREDGSSDLIDCDVWNNTANNQKPQGNINTDTLENINNKGKAFAIISDSCIKKMKYDETNSNQTIDILTAKAKYFPQLEVFLDKNGTYKYFQNYFDCSKPYPSPLCINNIAQLPLKQAIKMEDQGNLKLKIWGENLFETTVSGATRETLGSLNIKASKSCPLKEIYIKIIDRDFVGPINSSPFADNDSIRIPLTQLKLDPLSGEYENNIKRIMIRNNNAPNSISSNTPDTINVNSPKGWLYFGIKDKTYEDNKGIISLQTRVPRQTNNFLTQFFNDVIIKMDKMLYGELKADGNRDPRNAVVQIIYNNIIKAPAFRQIINIFMLMFISFYGLTLLMGLNQLNAGDLTRTALKIGLIYALLLPNSWEFFNNYLFKLFTEGPKYLLAALTTPEISASGTPIPVNVDKIDFALGPLSSMFSRFFDIAIWKKIISLLLAPPFGWMILILVIQSVWSLIFTMFSSLLVYLISINLIGIFISLAPLFIIMLMFKFTTRIFRAWLKVMIANALSLVFLFGGLHMVGSVIGVLLDDIFNYGVCNKCLMKISPLGGVLDFCVTYGAVPSGTPGGADITSSIENLTKMQAANNQIEGFGNNFFGLPIPINRVFVLLILTSIAKKLVDFLPSLASEVSGIMYGGAGGAGGIAESVEESMKWWVGKDRQSQQQKIKDLTSPKKIQQSLEKMEKEKEKKKKR